MSEKINVEEVRGYVLGSITNALARIETSNNLNNEIAADLNHVYKMVRKAMTPPTDTDSNVGDDKMDSALKVRTIDDPSLSDTYSFEDT